MHALSSFNNRTLAGQTFLITRPMCQASHLCTQINQHQGQSLLLPTLTIKPLSPSFLTEHIRRMPLQIDKIIFSSANAVYPVMPYWRLMGCSMPMVLAIGPGTAAALAQFGILAQLPKVQFNSEGLLALESLENIQGQKIIIFSGVGGRHLLTEALTQRGACVQKIAVYRRTQAQLEQNFPPSQPIDCILSSSLESLQNLWEMIGLKNQAWLIDQQLLVINAQMLQLAQRLGFKHPPYLAANASDAAVLETLLICRGKLPSPQSMA